MNAPAVLKTRRRLAAGKYAAVGKITFLGHLAYVPELLWRTIFMALIIFVFAQLWRTTYRATGATSLGGLSLAQMLWYLVTTETIILARPRLVGRVAEEVKSGDLAYRLSKPYSYVWYHYASYMAEAAIRLMVNFAVGALVAWFLVGPIPIRPAGAVCATLAAFLGLSIEFFINMTIGLTAFWVEDAAAFDLIYEKLLFILGGMMIPLDLFPGVIRQIALALPMNLVAYRPARALVAFNPNGIAPLFGIQTLWVAGLCVLAGLVFRAGVKRVNVNGG